MLSYIPKDEAGDEIRASVKAQIEAVENEGIIYTQNGTSHQEQHYNYKELTDAYDNYLAEFNKYDRDWTILDGLWKLIGKAQCNVPVFVAHHYCNPDESFYPTPKFDTPLRVRSLEFKNWITNEVQSWFPISIVANSSLGRDFSIWVGMARVPVGAAPERDWVGARVLASMDLAAITALFEVNTMKLEDVKKQYLNPQEAADLPTKKGP